MRDGVGFLPDISKVSLRAAVFQGSRCNSFDLLVAEVFQSAYRLRNPVLCQRSLFINITCNISRQTDPCLRPGNITAAAAVLVKYTNRDSTFKKLLFGTRFGLSGLFPSRKSGQDRFLRRQFCRL